MGCKPSSNNLHLFELLITLSIIYEGNNMENKKKFYTNGVKTIKLRLTDTVPEGF